MKSLEDPTKFWSDVAQMVTWDKSFDQVLDNSSE